MNKEKGFTLIELLAVIVILGIVVAIAIPGINSVIKNSRQKSLNSEASLIQTAAIRKLGEDPNFDFNMVNASNIKEYLETNGKGYDSVSIIIIDEKVHVLLEKDGLSTSTLPSNLANETFQVTYINFDISDDRFSTPKTVEYSKYSNSISLQPFPFNYLNEGEILVTDARIENGEIETYEMFYDRYTKTIKTSDIDINKPIYIYMAGYGSPANNDQAYNDYLETIKELNIKVIEIDSDDFMNYNVINEITQTKTVFKDDPIIEFSYNVTHGFGYSLINVFNKSNPNILTDVPLISLWNSGRDLELDLGAFDLNEPITIIIHPTLG